MTCQYAESRTLTFVCVCVCSSCTRVDLVEGLGVQTASNKFEHGAHRTTSEKSAHLRVFLQSRQQQRSQPLLQTHQLHTGSTCRVTKCGQLSHVDFHGKEIPPEAEQIHISSGSLCADSQARSPATEVHCRLMCLSHQQMRSRGSGRTR